MVKITEIKKGINNNSRQTPFMICIFENEYGFFPQKINLADSQKNKLFLQKIFAAINLSIENHEIEELKDKELSIYIGEYIGEFGKGIKVNKFHR